MNNLKVFSVINQAGRISSIDIFRSIAILAVVLAHFNEQFSLGGLGVDLFFVISGFLVGGILIKQLQSGTRINFFKFILQRGFKIWPSYYVFILVGNLIAFYFYRNTHPDQVIPLWDLKRYLFFYQNYTGTPFHWSFNHIWSLCVEEHFYIMLPILFLIIQFFIKREYRMHYLFVFVILTIIAGILFKYVSYYFTHSQDTCSGTHNRIDSLAWGVLLNLIITCFGEKIRSLKISVIAITGGLVIFLCTLYYSVTANDEFFNKIHLLTLVPFSFFLIMGGAYYFNFSAFKPLRFIAYYSYNWYLWHPLFVIYISHKFGHTAYGLIIYLIITFLIAIISTVLIEETFLAMRTRIVNKLK